MKPINFFTEIRQYLTSEVISLLSLKRHIIRTSGVKKEILPIKNDEEPSLAKEDYFMILFG